MRVRRVVSARLARVTVAMLVCAALSACNLGKPASTSSGTSSSPNPSTKAITLSWSPPTQNSDGSSITNLAGYTLHYGTSSGDLTGSIEITNPTDTSYVVSNSNFPAGTYYFAVSAYNAEQVSSPLSSEITVTVD